MARTRNLKPGFFRNDKLCSLTPMTRLLFAGLWTIADREGRLEDNPRRIRADIFPYEDRLGIAAVSRMLQDLHDAGFIVRYEVGIDNERARYICIPTWKQHQNPHIKEQVSTIPAPCSSGASTVPEPDENGNGQGSTVPSSNHLVPSTSNLPSLPGAGSGEQDMRITSQPEWKTDPSYQPFVEAYRKTGAAVIDEDFVSAYFSWRVMDFEQKARALNGITERVEKGVWSDPVMIHNPKNYLKGEYKRPVLARSRSGPVDPIEAAKQLARERRANA